jgi:DNA processing protein
MVRAEEMLAWMTLLRAPSLDAGILSKALAMLGDARGILRASDSMRARAGIPVSTRDFLKGGRGGPKRSELEWLRNPKHQLLPFTDSRYPRLLRSIQRPPLALYVAGNVAALNDPQLSIVGSRHPWPSGREIAFEFAEFLSRRGLGITSGLAQGIDSAAHRGTLAAQGITLAVLGSGVDVIYPDSNRSLSDEILFQGALISEFPLGTAPRPENFPRRNRIIAALSLGTLVVEAAHSSGSLITARLAADHNRELFAVPGSIRSPLSRGCHELIQQGAKLTARPADILTELNFSAFFEADKSSAKSPERPLRIEAGMDKEHKILLDALGFDSADLDLLVARSGFEPHAVSSMMLILELEGHVQAAPGGRYSRVVRSRR